MKIPYHRDITTRALEKEVSPRALQVIVRANIGQDGLRYQFGHDHFHFDSNSFDAAYAYIEEQRIRITDSLARGHADPACQGVDRARGQRGQTDEDELDGCERKAFLG